MTGAAPPCPYCSGRLAVLLETQSRDFWRCAGCGLIVRRDHGIGRGWPECGYLDGMSFETLARDQLEGHRDGIYGHLLDDLGPAPPSGRLLDVGCGCGYFLRAARNRGWDIRGIEPSRKSVEHLRRLLGDVELHDSLEDVSGGERFDAVTMLNVLDHLEEPWRAVESVSGLLRPGGLLLLRVPNGDFHAVALRLLLRLGLEATAWRLTVLHRYALTSGFLERLLSANGFAGIRIRNARLTDSVRIIGGQSDRFNAVARSLLWGAVRSLEQASAGRLRMGPSLCVRAIRT